MDEREHDDDAVDDAIDDVSEDAAHEDAAEGARSESDDAEQDAETSSEEDEAADDVRAESGDSEQDAEASSDDGEEAPSVEAAESGDDGEEAPSVEAAESGDDTVASEEAADDGPALAGDSDRRARPRPMWQKVAHLLLPPVLAAAAMGVHWTLNVPDKIVENPRDQGAKNKKKKKKKARKGRTREGRKGKSARHEARTPEQLDQAWERYGEAPFENEPTLPTWARRHQALINRAVVVARQHAFEGAPEKPRVVLSDTKCRTIRCRFLLRSPYRHELDVITDSLSRLQAEEQDIWRSYTAGAIELAEGDKGEQGQQQVEVIVAFETDETYSRSLAIAPAEDESGGAPEPTDAKAVADAPDKAPTPPPRDG